MSKPVRIPGPDHPITVTPTPGRVLVKAGAHVVADSGSAVTLQESSYPAAHYVPRADVDMTQLTRTTHSTYCPYKGDASYYSLPNAENAVWTYESPHPAMEIIKEYVSFYPDRVDSIEVIDA